MKFKIVYVTWKWQVQNLIVACLDFQNKQKKPKHKFKKSNSVYIGNIIAVVFLVVARSGLIKASIMLLLVVIGDVFHSYLPVNNGQFGKWPGNAIELPQKSDLFHWIMMALP